jgi:hypothetical protein
MPVEDPEVIDLIWLSDDGAQISLVAVEERPLRDDQRQLFEIDRKLGMYMQALDSGQVPEAAGRLVSLLLVVPNEPRTSRARDLLERIHRSCIERGEGFSLRVQRYPDSYADAIGLSEAEQRAYDDAVDAPLPYPVVRVDLDEDDAEAWRKPAEETADPGRLERFKRMLGGSDGIDGSDD